MIINSLPTQHNMPSSGRALFEHTLSVAVTAHFHSKNISQYEYEIYYDSSNKQQHCQLIHLLIIMYNMFAHYNGNSSSVKCENNIYERLLFVEGSRLLLMLSGG